MMMPAFFGTRSHSHSSFQNKNYGSEALQAGSMRDNESNDPLKWLNFCLLLFVLLNGLLSSFLITYQSRIHWETLQTLKYIESRLESISTRDGLFQEIKAAEVMENSEYKMIEEEEMELPLEEVLRNTDPVSVLNKEEGPHTLYECATICRNPPINRAVLTMNEVNGTWEGQAKSKQAAKQIVAYKAIQEKFQHLHDQIDPPYQLEVYDPLCQDPEDGLPDPPLKKC